jgi:hypothetical protein
VLDVQEEIFNEHVGRSVIVLICLVNLLEQKIANVSFIKLTNICILLKHVCKCKVSRKGILLQDSMEVYQIHASPLTHVDICKYKYINLYS